MESLKIKPEEYNTWIKTQLEQLKDMNLKAFSSKLLPGVKNILGVRLPDLRKIAMQLADCEWETYLSHAVDDTYEEIMLQGMVLGYAKGDLKMKQEYLQTFISKINNWSVCDSACATIKLAKEQPEEMWEFLQEYLYSDKEYYVRFALVQMLNYYVNQDYLSRVLAAADSVHLDYYYVKMAQAWVVSICYRDFPEETLPYLKENHLDNFTHNKAIRKITESLKVSEEEKECIRALKR